MKARKKRTLLILENDGFELAKYNAALRAFGYICNGVQSIEKARDFIKGYKVDLVLSDIHLTHDKEDGMGLVFLEEVRHQYPEVIRLAMSKDPKIEMSEKVKAIGTSTLLRKPFAPGEQELVIHINRAFEVEEMLQVKDKTTHLQRAFLSKHPEGIILTADMRKQIKVAIRETTLPITIEGETGTGKEEVVKYIHAQLSKDGNIPLVSINCANLKGDLAASTLFGHKKGAFTGATENSVGAVGKANKGILFLDEFHRLSESVQEQILRTVQDGSYHRLGDNTDLYSQFRLVIATPKNLEQYALEGKILLDLRFRLYGIDIRIPPLRERLDQMPDFIECFIANFNRKINLPAEERQKLIERCSEFHWQGNVRQLFGVLQMLVVQAHAADEPIKAVNLPVYPTMLPPPVLKLVDGKYMETVDLNRKSGSGDDIVNLLQTYIDHPTSYEDFMDILERKLITRLMAKYKTIKELCEAVKINRGSLDNKRRRLGLTDSESRQQ